MMDNIFVEDPRINRIKPPSLNNAMVAATRILRSQAYRDVVVNIYSDLPKHIDQDKLETLLNRNHLITLSYGRSIETIVARASVMPAYDPFRIYFNPLLFLEMKDLEEHLAELRANPALVTQVGTIYDFNSSLKEDSSSNLRSNVNSLVYSEQFTLDDRYEEIKKAAIAKVKRAANTKPKQPRIDDDAPDLSSLNYPSGLEPNKGGYVGLAVPPYSNNYTPKCLQDPTVDFLNTCLLTFLLVHETSHLINYALSNAMTMDENGVKTTPYMHFGENGTHRGKQIVRFRDFGHMVEKRLFGYVIQHSVDPTLKAPFGIQEIIGCNYEGESNGYVVVPSSQLRSIILNNDVNTPITAAMLQLVAVCPFNGTYLSEEKSRMCALIAVGPKDEVEEEKKEEENQEVVVSRRFRLVKH